jgi:DNA topoisomerase 6 subunit A-like protein
VSPKDVVLDNLDQAIADASGDGAFRFNERQLFYQLRPIVLDETGQPLQITNFKAILTDYKNENGEIQGMYREPRGSIYHPHCKEEIPLGTLTVEDYERPAWTFNKLVYIEKEGFSEALKASGWAERHDCMLMSSKGFSTRAAKDLIDKLVEHDEPVTVFCVHDADAAGTMIHQTLQGETRARGARKIRIINLGLDPWEAIDLGLEVEDVEEKKRNKLVAKYVTDREDTAPDGNEWDEWLQDYRVELNAMTTPQFIEWLDAKMAEHGNGKLIPPPEVVAEELEAKFEEDLRAAVTERILREADFEGQVARAMAEVERPTDTDMVTAIQPRLEKTPAEEWREYIRVTSKALTAPYEPKL